MIDEFSVRVIFIEYCYRFHLRSSFFVLRSSFFYLRSSIVDLHNTVHISM